MEYGFKTTRSARIHNAVKLSDGTFGVYYVTSKTVWGVAKTTTRYGTVTVAPATNIGTLLLGNGARVPGRIVERAARHEPSFHEREGTGTIRLYCSCGWTPPFNTYATRAAAAEVFERHAIAHGYEATFPKL